MSVTFLYPFMWFVPRESCPPLFWQDDHIERCHLQRYFEFAPIAICLSIAVVYTVCTCTIPAFKLVNRVLSGKKSSHTKETLIERPLDRSDQSAWIVIRSKSIGDKLRIVSEIILCAGESAVFLFLWANDTVRDEYTLYSPNTISFTCLLSFYALGLNLYRLAGANAIEHLPGRPFIQCTYIYAVQLFVHVVSCYSYSKEPLEDIPYFETYLLVASIASLLKIVILYTSPLGDAAARIYRVPLSPPSLEPVASLLRQMTCCWNTGLIFSASKKPQLDPQDVWLLTEDLHSYKLFNDFSACHPTWSLVWRLAVCFKSMIAGNLFFGCAGNLLSLAPTFFVNRILKYAEDTSATPKATAWLYVAGIAGSLLLSNTVLNQSFYHGRRLSVALRAVIIGEIYQKALLSQVSKTDDETKSGEETDAPSTEEEDADAKFNTANTGAIINLMSVDAFKIAEFAAYLHYLFASPLVVVFGVCYLYTILGASAFAGVLMMILTIPLNYQVAKTLGNLQEKVMAITDKRVDKTNESLNAVRIIKYFAWEDKFISGILALRDKELDVLWYRYIWWSFGGMIFFALPLLITAASFICYVKIEQKALTSSIAFTAMAIFNILRYPLDDIATNVSSFMSSKVSMERIQKYLNTDDTPKYTLIDPSKPTDPNAPKLGFEKATFSWDRKASESSAFKLHDLDVKFVESDLNVIIGPTGSGKTSMLMALLGEMFLVNGQVFLPNAANRRTAQYGPDGYTDTVAFCPQQAWMVNDTVRNNILFASPYDRSRYQQILKVCELESDLKILNNGDRTLIGDKGVSLSGGQKQRISLARALYSSSRHLILDDCLSAVDSHTADAIYNNALVGPIAHGRTVVLVSHNVALTVSKAAQVIVMRNGRVEACGTPNELSEAGSLGDDELILSRARASELSRANSRTDLATLSKLNATTETARPTVLQTDAQLVTDLQQSRNIDRRDSAAGEVNEMEQETRGLGSIPLSTYTNYARSLGSPLWWLIMIIILILLPVGQYVENWWLKKWTTSYQSVLSSLHVRLTIALTAYTKDEDAAHSIIFYSGIYILTGVVYALFCTFSELYSCSGSIRASTKTFRAMLYSIMHAKIEFFDNTPIGRIINRFSKDIEDIDQELCFELHHFIRCILDAIAVTLVISYTTPAFLPAAILICLVYTFIGKYYLTASRELKRLESTSRSPIFQQFGETLNGAVCIRAYGDVNRFSTSNMNLVDTSHRPYINLWLANRWLAYWSSFMSTVVVMLAAFFVVWNADRLGAGMAGVSLSYSMMFGDAILWIVRMYAQVEIHMNSIERIQEYIDVDREADPIIPENRPADSWPQKGAIEFKDLSLRYKPGLPLVIKDVSFKVEGGQKIGVVGRTGAGKSTILSAIFRILEPVSGSVCIDGLDISTIGLYDLRKALAIIPQDPTLFTGTLRSNLDLFDEYTDNEIFSALSRVNLVKVGTTSTSAAEILANSGEENVNQFYDLNSDVTEGGNNLSQGQRQLLCLARAVLRRPRVLVMDEATASIDYETDSLIQVTIREEFSDVTILTIAHRLRTIADYDRVLVLDKGELAQYGSPAELLEEKNGLYYDMCAKSGDLETLINLARKH